MPSKIVPLIATAAAFAAPVSAAEAAVGIQLQKPGSCAVDQGEKLGTTPVGFVVSGLAPGQTANVTLSGQGVTGAPVPVVGPPDGSGTATASATWTSALGLKPLGDTPATLTVTDSVTGAPLATTPAVVSTAAIDIVGKKVKGKLPKQVTWEVSGRPAITGSTTYYAFYFKVNDLKKKKSPKPVDSEKLGTGTGACGYLKSKRPPAPFKTKGTYAIIVQTSKTFDEKGLGLIGALKQ
ncbi:MAG: hypothetical protein AAGC46_16470 [Solirubrobacteraceae bacterium]|nr:hypothetical protein [Patulibacter sp.]